MKECRTELELLEEMSNKLDRLLGFVAASDREQDEQITVLQSLGFEWGEIGLIAGLSPHAARIRSNSGKRQTTKTRSNKRSPKGEA
jgi:hypothetical protein